MLTGLRLENFACFPRLDLRLGPFNVLVGPNDSGKTTLLQALLLLARLEHGHETASWLGLPRLRWAGPEATADRPIQHQVLGQAGVTQYSLTSTLDDRGVLVSQRLEADETLWLPGKNVRSWCHVELAGQQDRTRRLSYAEELRSLTDLLDHGECEKLTAETRSCLYQLQSLRRGVRKYRLDPGALKSPSDPARAEDIPELGAHGGGLPTVLSVMAGAERERITRIEDAFVRAVPTLAGFAVKPTPQGQHRLVFNLAEKSGSLEASQVSDGALLFLGFLTLLHHPHPPALLLIEEPENGVHPERLRDIARLLRLLAEPESGAVPGAQIVLTTHSPYLLDEVSPDQACFCFRRDEDGAAEVHRFSDVSGIEERLAEFKLGELWTAYGEKRLARQVGQ